MIRQRIRALWARLMRAFGNDPSAQLIEASISGDVSYVMTHLEKHAAVNVQDGFHWNATPLHHAVCGGHEQMAFLLIQAGADVNARDNALWSPLHTAVFHDRKHIVDLLLASGAHVNAQDQMGNTPLYDAVVMGNIALVGTLLDAGADVNAPDDMGNTPLHEAVAWRREDMVQALLRCGANVHAANHRGQQPWHHSMVRTLFAAHHAEPSVAASSVVDMLPTKAAVSCRPYRRSARKEVFYKKPLMV